MILYRSAVLGLLTALVLLLVSSRPPAPEPRRSEAPTVVDVSRTAMRASGVGLGVLVGARCDEHVVSIAGLVDGRAAADDLVPGSYLDVELASASGARRVLVLVHP
jgi:hypothetical protein